MTHFNYNVDVCSHCWSHGTYHLPYDSDIPPDTTYDKDDNARNHHYRHHQQHQHPPPRLCYYQYVPLILLSQAFGFYLPYLVWMRLSNGSGLDLQSLVQSARRSDSIDMADIQSRSLLDMTHQLDRYKQGRCCDYHGFCVRCLSSDCLDLCFVTFGPQK